ncbi:MAG: cytochrome c [Rhizobiaceae bacterium]|nr:cytochrome c [Rhizobiaceae bacterium]
MRKFAVVLSLVALGTGVAIADPAEDREALMKTFGKSMGDLGPYAKGEKAYDAPAVLAALTTLNENAQKLDVVALFPEGVTGERASPKIWENFADFQAHAEKLKASTAAAVAAAPADQAALGKEMGAIGGVCGTCHELYRIKK